MIVCVGGIKGGSGKTTVATNLAIMRASDVSRVATSRHSDVLLIDADDQATATDFVQLRLATEATWSCTCVQLSGRAVFSETQKLRGKYADIVIDTGGRDTSSQRGALAVADLLLVPFVPRSFDVWTLEQVASLVEEMRAANPQLGAWSFLNRADARGQDNAQAAEVLRESKVIRFQELQLGQRKAFANAAAEGLAVCETQDDDKACAEMQALYAKVFAKPARKG